MSLVNEHRAVRRPIAGWRGDTTVILGVRALLTDVLGGVAEDLLPGEVDLPDHMGAVVACSWRWHPPKPYVYVRADQPTDLRADLWGFAAALASSVCEGRLPLGEEDFLFIGNRRVPGAGSGTALLGSAVLRRLGRRNAVCDFPVYRWTDGASPALLAPAA
ncbi:hypothetical protein ABIA32_000944 [Streptacidiphilus sp. MAP12-20]|uniref:hypothetical protein n=1 Tax=Streptacidiphilus sp. MAP12-20 TaxID=3156299 RepID=UPI0035140BC5